MGKTNLTYLGGRFMITRVNEDVNEAKGIFNEIKQDLTKDEIEKVEKIIQSLLDTIKKCKNGSEFDHACGTNPIIDSKTIFAEISQNIAQKGEKAEHMVYLLDYVMSGRAGWDYNED
jgi:hypothetical protein